MIHKVFARFLLGLSILFCAFIYYTTTFWSSASLVRAHTLEFIVSGVFLALLMFCLFLFLRKPSILWSAIIFAIVLLLGLVLLAGLNCSSRCIPYDYSNQQTLLRAQDAIEKYFEAYGSYPPTLGEMDPSSLGYQPITIQYSSARNSYRACIQKNVHYFYNIQISSGEPYCVSSDSNSNIVR